MLFNSYIFALFLPVVFGIYWWLKRFGKDAQNIVLLVSSYVFYGWWDWRFLILILLSSMVDFFAGKAIANNVGKQKKMILIASVAFNIGLLAVFKYFNFFQESLIEVFTHVGLQIEPFSLSIILPVGISFYTFQTMSYSLDIYKGKLQPNDDIVQFFCFVSFFPQLVAGPIERAKSLLPQFSRVRTFDYDMAVDGCRQMLWGFFKKVAIGDNCAYFVNLIFADYSDYSPPSLFIGALLFSVQIYADFSGYSDIAIGCSKLFGIKLNQNFAYPYFSRNIGEFWRRWHVSLSSWFRDYVYIPLGGSRGPKGQAIRNIFIVFLVSGLWHGANWTFVIWGLFHALLFLPAFLTESNRTFLTPIDPTRLPSAKALFQISGTFLLALIGWIIFRSESIADAYLYFMGFTKSGTESIVLNKFLLLELSISIAIMLIVEWFHQHNEHGLSRIQLGMNKTIRIAVYLGLILWTMSTAGQQQEFIYFQF